MAVWVRVGERLPDTTPMMGGSFDVLVVDAYGTCHVAYLCYWQRLWFKNAEHGFEQVRDVTHWCTLPALPGKEGSNDKQ